MISLRGEAGFTLMELLVTMVITSIVFGATLSVLDVFQSDNRHELLRNETQDNARNSLDRLGRDLRNVAAPKSVPELPGALEVAKRYSLVFQTISTEPGYEWGKNLSHAIRVRYCVATANPSNEVLWKQSTRWKEEHAPALPTVTTCPDLTAGDWETSTRMVEHVTNRIGGRTRRLFLYGPGTEPPTTEINSIEVNMFIDLSPGTRQLCGSNHEESCTETQLTSAISLRNANRQPTAFFTAQQLGFERHVFLNASESQDPQGLALTYKWWQNGALLNTTSQQYETPKGFTAGTSQAFKLEVTDPGGLSSTYERTVLIQ
jgi:prepilin-type N-terminal cleavage/methylation domain-containing protein